MIVNESGLLSAMKDSYKLGGYHIAVGEVFRKKCYLIASSGDQIREDAQKSPRSAG